MLNPLFFIVVGILYAVGKVYLEKRLAPMDAAGSERRLADLAFACGCSEYDIFKRAAGTWQFSERKSDQDFKRYVKTGHLPTYVAQYLEKHNRKGDSTYQQLIFSGGRPPYL